ncbi:MAG: LuxR C-terminal-related transcriptional regulator [Gemmatimonadales bacterium]
MAKNTVRSARSNRARTLIVDDHPVTRRGLAKVVQETADLVLCGEIDGGSVTRDFVSRAKPDVAIVNLSLKLFDALSVIELLTELRPGPCVLALSLHNAPFDAERALRAGARGYVVGWEAPKTLLTAVRKVLGGGVYLDPETQAELIYILFHGEGRAGVASLSDREAEVLRLTGLGLSTREIAQELGLSPKTVESYRQHLKKKLNVENLTQLIRFAVLWVSTRAF